MDNTTNALAQNDAFISHRQKKSDVTDTASAVVVLPATWCAVPLTVLAALLRLGLTESLRCSMREWLMQAECDVHERSDACASAQALRHDLVCFCRSLADAHERLRSRSSYSSSSMKPARLTGGSLGYVFLTPTEHEPDSGTSATTRTQTMCDRNTGKVRDEHSEKDEDEPSSSSVCRSMTRVEEQPVLHPAVAAELRAVTVVMRLSSRPAVSSPCEASAWWRALFPPGVCDYVLSLHDAHSSNSDSCNEAVTQIAVGLADAVDYVVRKTNRAVPRWRHRAPRAQSAAHTSSSVAVDELAEDEFALVSSPMTMPTAHAPPTMPRRERQRWSRLNRKLQRMEKEGGGGGEAAAAAADWVQERRAATEGARMHAASARRRTERAWHK